jgi:hypothetical protein
MHICSLDLEDQIFHLMDGTRTPREVAQILEMDYREALPIIQRVVHERGTAHRAAIAEGLERLEAIASRL